MKNERIYSLLIIFTIFYFFKKILSIVIESKFPTYDNLENASEFWKTLIKIRSINVIITFICLVYFLYNFTFSFFIRTIFLIIIFNTFVYFLIDGKLIYLFVDSTEKTDQYVYFLDTYGDKVENLIIESFALYALFSIIYRPL